MRDLIGRTLGHYRVLSKLGEGGMGEVYRAHDERLDRDVAIKVLHESVAQDADRLARFEREAKAIAKLDHPNILAIHDFGTDQGVTFAITELLDGQDLRQSIQASGMSWQKVVEIGAAIADGLAAAHSKGIVHRDVKPENVFITSDGRVKILDFGLAQTRVPVDEDAETATLTPAGTVPGTVMGTVGYMSPEQLRGEPADGRSDIFALGCVLYEMLSGQPAFLRGTTAETTAAILKEEPPGLTAPGVTVPADLERTIRRCLEKSPEARFQSVSDLAFALRSISTDHAVPTATPTVVTPARAKRTLWVAALAVVALAATAVMVGPRIFERSIPAAEGQTIRTLAVLPLQNISGDPEQEFFADGMTEALITELGKISAIGVIGRHSVMRYKGSDAPLEQIAEALNVDAFVVGSTVSSGDRVRIAIQLTSPRGDRLIWSEGYERELADIVALQGEVARAIAREIQAGLTPEEERRLTQTRRVDPGAHEEYMRGLHNLSRFKYVEGIAHFERAVELDPNFADAYATMASALILVGGARSPDEMANFDQRARQGLKKALMLDPDLSEAHRALGDIKKSYDWDWIGAEAAYKHAVELNPSSAASQTSLGLFLVYMGQFDEGVERCEAAQQLDPFSLETNIWLAYAYFLAHHFDDSIARLEFIRELDPGWGQIHHCLGITYAAKGLWDEAIASCNRYTGHKIPEYCGSVYALAGHRDQALERLQFCSTETDANPLCMAGIHAGLGEIDEAIAWIETAFEERGVWLLPWMRTPVLTENLRDDPRFQDIMRRMNLPEYKR
jgi:serine/threonine-protein kinase